MIIKGKSRAGAGSLNRHLLNAEKNERVTLGEIRGTLAQDLLGALQEMEDAALGTRCEKGIYHAKVSPAPTELMTPERWDRAFQALEENLGLSPNHPRAIVFHELKGRIHAHVAWGRVDPETMKVWRDSNNYIKHEQTSRQLEREFDHERVQGVFGRDEGTVRPARTVPEWEMQQGDRLKYDARHAWQEIREIHSRCDSGRSFAAALDEAGYVLAKGDRRVLVVVNPDGGVSSLAKALDIRTAALRSFMADVDRDALPTVDQATARVLERAVARQAVPEPVTAPEAAAPVPQAPQRQAEPPAAPPAPYAGLKATHEAVSADREADKLAAAAVIKESWRDAGGDALEFAIRLGDRGLTLAENDQGRAVAVDSRGASHYLSRASLGVDPHVVQEALAATFGAEKPISLPGVAEVRSQARAENAAQWRSAPGPDRLGAYADLSAHRIGHHQRLLVHRAALQAAALEQQRDRIKNSETVQAINAAWQEFERNPRTTLAAALDDRDIILARVSPEEAAASRQAQSAVRLQGEKIPRALQAGDLYGINRFGAAWALDAVTIRADMPDIARQLSTLEVNQPTLTEARAAQQLRRDEERDARQEEYRQARADRIAKLPDVHALRDAYTWFTTPTGLVEAIERRGFTLTRVTAEEEHALRYNAKVAESHGHYRPVYAEGDLVAISAAGRAYRLDPVTLDDRNAHARLGAIDQAPLLSLDQARQVMRHFSADAKAPEHKPGFMGTADTRGSDDALFGPTLGGIAGGLEKLAGWLEEFLFGSSKGPTPPAPERPIEVPAETAAQRFKRETSMTPPEVLLQSADFMGKKDTFTLEVDPVVVAAMRRKIEAARLREMTDEDRDRDR